MDLMALDIIVLIVVGGAAMLGVVRGFVTEVLSLFAWVAIVFAIKLFHVPLTHALTGVIGTAAAAAILAFAILAGGTYFAGRMVANAIGARTRDSVMGPIDRALGFGFGAVKGLILASLGFLMVVLVTDTMGGGPTHRPLWLKSARVYPLLNVTSAGIADFVDRRRKGLPLFEPTLGRTTPAQPVNDAKRGD